MPVSKKLVQSDLYVLNQLLNVALFCQHIVEQVHYCVACLVEKVLTRAAYVVPCSS